GWDPVRARVPAEARARDGHRHGHRDRGELLDGAFGLARSRPGRSPPAHPRGLDGHRHLRGPRNRALSERASLSGSRVPLVIVDLVESGAPDLIHAPGARSQPSQLPIVLTKGYSSGSSSNLLGRCPPRSSLKFLSVNGTAQSYGTAPDVPSRYITSLPAARLLQPSSNPYLRTAKKSARRGDHGAQRRGRLHHSQNPVPTQDTYLNVVGPVILQHVSRCSGPQSDSRCQTRRSRPFGRSSARTSHPSEA